MRSALLALVLSAPFAADASGVAKGGSGPLRTAYTRVNVVVDGDVARTTVTQVFVNDLPSPVEVTYGFPLPEDAVVTGFADWRDGKRFDAGVTGREAARETYEAAVAEGRRAALAEVDEGTRFQMSLYGVAAGASRRVELRYSQTLSALGGERSYVFPAGTGAAPTVLDFEASVTGDRRILGIDAPNHADARVSNDGASRRHVVLSRTRTGLERDLALTWRQETEALDLAARAVRVEAGRPGYVEARFAFDGDPFEGIRPPRDVVLVVDASLSMAGEPLDRARALATSVLDALDTADRVNLVTFDHEVTPVFEGPRAATPARRDQLKKVLAGLRARGRSDLQGALLAAGEMLRGSEDGVLLVATDGQPTASAGSDPFSLSLDPADFATTRVVVAQFNYPSRSDDLLALFPSGSSRFVPDGPAGEKATDAVVRLATAPTLDDLSFEIEGGGVHDVHGTLPARLAVGESVRLMARATSSVVVRVEGTVHGAPVSLEQRVDVPTAAGPDRGLPVEWGRLRVRELEAEWRRLASEDPPAAEIVEAEIRGLGTELGLGTRFTSYVLADGLAPDAIKPGDPEIRIHAPKSALGVRGVLPWGEEVPCSWSPAEGLWLGRFLVPRGVKDGLYRVRVFVDEQSGTRYRGVLYFRVDSRPPTFELSVEGDLASGDLVKVFAWPLVEVEEAKNGDRVDPDPVDVRRVLVRVGRWEFPLERVGELWMADVPLDLPPGRHAVKLLAMDAARNTSETTLWIDVE